MSDISANANSLVEYANRILEYVVTLILIVTCTIQSVIRPHFNGKFMELDTWCIDEKPPNFRQCAGTCGLCPGACEDIWDGCSHFLAPCSDDIKRYCYCLYKINQISFQKLPENVRNVQIIIFQPLPN